MISNIISRSGGIDPRSISGLAFWLDASDASSLTFNGSKVSQWRDKSGGNRHANQANVDFQPTYIANGINGRPALVGDGIDDFMTWSVFTSGTNHNFYVVAAFDAGINKFTQYGGFFGAVKKTSHNLFFSDVSANPMIRIRIMMAGDMTISPANGPKNIRTGIPAVYSLLRNGGLYRAKWTYGTVQSMSLSDGHATEVTSSDLIFKNYFAAISFRIAEIVCYSRDLTATEEVAMSSYFLDRYGVGI